MGNPDYRKLPLLYVVQVRGRWGSGWGSRRGRRLLRRQAQGGKAPPQVVRLPSTRRGGLCRCRGEHTPPLLPTWAAKLPTGIPSQQGYGVKPRAGNYDSGGGRRARRENAGGGGSGAAAAAPPRWPPPPTPPPLAVEPVPPPPPPPPAPAAPPPTAGSTTPAGRGGNGDSYTWAAKYARLWSRHLSQVIWGLSSG